MIFGSVTLAMVEVCTPSCLKVDYKFSLFQNEAIGFNLLISVNISCLAADCESVTYGIHLSFISFTSFVYHGLLLIHLLNTKLAN